jgi:mannosyl-3-phosphoglycerate synthase
VPTENQEAMDKGIEVMQVETRNPHFHEEKGDIHLKEMIDGSLGCIYHSKICHPKLREKIVEELRGKGVIEENQEPSVLQKINPFKDIDMLQFGKILHNKATSFVHS